MGDVYDGYMYLGRGICLDLTAKAAQVVFENPLPWKWIPHVCSHPFSIFHSKDQVKEVYVLDSWCENQDWEIWTKEELAEQRAIEKWKKRKNSKSSKKRSKKETQLKLNLK